MSSVAPGGIYAIRHVVSGKVYIGSAMNFKQRWSMHRSLLRRGVHHSHYLQNSWTKYGKDAFVFEILEIVDDPNNLISIEQEYLDTFEPWRPEIGYNVAKDSVISVKGMIRSPETRAKMSEANKKRWADPEYRARTSASMKGKKRSAEASAKIGAAKKGSRHTPEARAKISESLKRTGRTPESWAKIVEMNKGRVHTPETRAKLSEIAKQRNADPGYRAKLSEIGKKRAAKKREAREALVVGDNIRR